MIDINEFNKPDRNIVVTGIVRSGTSLLSSLLCKIPNCYCFNEIFYSLDKLPAHLAEARYKIKFGLPVPNKYKDGKLTTNTMQGEAVEKYVLKGDYDENVVLGSNVNFPYINSINFILDYLGYHIISVVRNPIYAIASWNSDRCNQIAAHNLMQVQQRFFHVPFTKNTNVGRQVELWIYYFRVLYSLYNARIIALCKYEDLVNDPNSYLENFCIRYKLEKPVFPKLESCNVESRYDFDLNEIRKEFVSQLNGKPEIKKWFQKIGYYSSLVLSKNEL